MKALMRLITRLDRTCVGKTEMVLVYCRFRITALAALLSLLDAWCVVRWACIVEEHLHDLHN